MKAVILAAGAGRRLGALTAEIPKCLLRIASDRVLLDVMLQTLEEVGVESVTIIGGHRLEALEEHLRDYWSNRTFSHEIIFNRAYNTTNNIVSLGCLGDDVIGDDQVLLLNSDVLCPSTVIERLVAEDGSVLAVDDSKELGHEEMKVALGQDMYITRISKTLDTRESKGEYIGAAKFDPHTLGLFLSRIRALISRGKTDLYYEDALDHAIASGDLRVRAMLIGGVPWTEVDTPEDLEYARTIYQRFWE